jgi:uncharacterized protein YbjT (DUF2867 family)
VNAAPAAARSRVAVIGASGTIGFVMTRALLDLGHDVLAVTRARARDNDARLGELEAAGAALRVQPDLTDEGSLAAALRGRQVLVVAMRASPRIIPALEPAILRAALRADVERFVPDDFGTNSKATPYGLSAHFDAKKRFQEQLEASGMPWTVIYPGGIAEYFLPNLRPPATVYRWGDVRLPLALHTLADIGAVSARAVTDPRTVGHAVQLHANMPTTEQMIERLERNWPGRRFTVDTLTSEQLARLHREGNPDPGDERLAEREIMGISYANYVLGLLAVPDQPGTLSAAALYPDYRYTDPLELLADPAFVFGATVCP